MSSKIFNNTKINVEFDEDYQSRININSGENISSLFAKIRRFILDLKSVAFSGSYNDLSDTPDVVTKEYVDGEVNTNIAYGTCTTDAATAEKVVTIVDNPNWKLQAGSIVVVKFSYTNTAQNPKLNVNGTGAKSIWYNTALLTTSNLGYAAYANRYISFLYDGAQFIFIGWSADQNTTYTNASLGQVYGTCTTDEATTTKTVSLTYVLSIGGIVAIKFTNAVPAGSTLNINNKGAKAIYYKGNAITDGIIKAGDTATFIYSGQYHLIAIDRDAATNAELTESIAAVKNDIALNRTTLGMQRKNLLKNMAVSTAYSDVKFTVNSDGTVDVSSTAVSTGTRFLMIGTFTLEPGSYVLTGADSLANYGDIRAYIDDVVYKHNEPFTLNETSTVIVRICVYINRNLPDTVRVYPMIRCTAISDSTYEPYQPSLKELLSELEARIAALEG